MVIQITYRRTSRLSMRIVSNGDVHVSVPYGVPRSEVDRFIHEHEDWINAARKRTLEHAKKREDFYAQLPLETRSQRMEAKRRLDALILPLVERHAEKMRVSPSRIQYRATTSRWGSCNIKTKAICFSCYLLLLPEWCIEHVVVHELCHLLEPNHSPRFHALMDHYYPRWREARAETRRISRMEEDDI